MSITDKFDDYDETNSSDEILKKEYANDADVGADMPLSGNDNSDELEDDNIYSHQHLDFADLRLDDFEKEGDEPDENESEADGSDEADSGEIETESDRLKKKGRERLKAERKLRDYYRSQEEIEKSAGSKNAYTGSHLKFSDLRNGDITVNDIKLPEPVEESGKDTEINQPGHDETKTSAEDEKIQQAQNKLYAENNDYKPPHAEISEENHENIKALHLDKDENSVNAGINNPDVVSPDAVFINDDTAWTFNSYEEGRLNAILGIDSEEDDTEKALKDAETAKTGTAAENSLSVEGTEDDGYEHFSTYEFGRLAGNLAKGISINTLNATFSGISGDYSKGSRDVALAAADTFVSMVSKAAASFEKLTYNSKIKAADTLEEIRKMQAYSDFKPDSLAGEGGKELREALIKAGISEKDIGNLYKYRDVVDDELTIKRLILEKAESDSYEVPEELKKYVLKKGFKNLSSRSELKLAEILNKENGNAEVRNLNFSTLSAGKLKSLKDKLYKEKRLDRTSEMLINKAIAAKKRGVFEKRDVGLSMKRVYERIRSSRQDLFTRTVKDITDSTRNTKNNVKFVILGTQTAYAFYKKSVKMGSRLIKSKSFRRSSQSFDRIRTNKNVPDRLSGAMKAANAAGIAKTLGSAVTSSTIVSESEEEEKQKKEKRQEFVEKTVEGRRITEKFRNRISENGFKKEAGSALKHRSKEAAKKTAKDTAARKASKTLAGAGAKEGAKSVSFMAKLSESVTSFLASIPIPVWIAIGIFILILIMVHFLRAFAAAESIGDSVREASEKMISEVTKMSDTFTDAMKEINESTILVSNKLTDDEKYVDIKDYLKQLQAYDEKREENAIKFAEAPISSINPKSISLMPYQKNGIIGQDSNVLCEKNITHYGSLDKKNAYTLHYMDAYGNEIANHSTNARDVLSLCAVIFSNYSDDKHVFKFLLEDEWYLLNPKIEWQESEVYCCNTSDAHIEGEIAYYIACDGGLERGEKYRPSTDHFWYYCNKQDDTDRVKGYRDAGAKLTGDYKTYDEKGCKKRIESTEFEGDGYDTYDLYLDDYISYEDYLYYVNTYSDEYIIKGTFYKDVWYCDGHFINCCFGHKDIDLYITLYDKDYAIANNIYPDPYSSHSGKYDRYLEFLDLFLSDDGFDNEGRIRWVDAIYENDWFDIYGIDVFGGAGFEIGGTLTDADIESILGRLSEGELSIIQQAIIEFALRYVGRIPYYFGGKAAYLDYESNHFYSIVEPDNKGRTRKGLDCSGFVSWVFANKGISIPSSTAGFSGYVTSRDHSSLKVGDLGFLNKPGAKNNHIGIYAGKDENGSDLWIHCNASAGNVSVNNYNGFKYYFSLTD